GVTGPYRLVRDAFVDVAAKGEVDASLGRPDDFAIPLAQIAHVEPDHAGAEISGHYFGIGAYELAQFGKPGAAAGIDLGNDAIDAFLPHRPALEQDFVLAAEVGVERRL